MRPTPINVAEAITDPFCDPLFATLEKWTVSSGKRHGLEIVSEWKGVAFSWERAPKTGPVLRMRRKRKIDCGEYDRLMISVILPEDAKLVLIAETDRGTLSGEYPAHKGIKFEYFLGLDGATHISEIALEVHVNGDGAGRGELTWIGLQSQELLRIHLRQWEGIDARWDDHLKPASYEPSFAPSGGYFLTRKQVNDLRRRHQAEMKQRGESLFTRDRDALIKAQPEKMVKDFIGSGPARFERDRDRDSDFPFVEAATRAAVAGVVLRDRKLLRLAARGVLSLARYQYWEDGFVAHYPGGAFCHRCFTQTGITYAIASVLDLAGDLFTELGRENLLRRLSEDGLGSINRNSWKFEYMYRCNQLALACRGRVLGYAALDHWWTEEGNPRRVLPYMEVSNDELVDTLNYCVEPDGGNLEGSIYCLAYLGCVCVSLFHYAQFKGVPFESAVPEAVKRSARYADVIQTTDEDNPCLYMTLTDTRDVGIPHDQRFLAFLAAAVPDSAWTSMFRKSMERTEEIPTSAIVGVLERQIPRQGPAPSTFSSLPDTGLVSSVRELDGELVKILVESGTSGSGHVHEHHGGFVLEFAGQTFALDPGQCAYAHPLSGEMGWCQRHCVLVPSGVDGRPHPDKLDRTDTRGDGPLRKIPLCAQGNARRFHAEADVTRAWKTYYRKWVRSYDSPSPDRLVIRDAYALKRGDGVDFQWITQRDIEVEGHRVSLLGRRGRVVIEAPEDCQIQVDELPLYDAPGLLLPRTDSLSRIAIRKKAKSGVLEVRVRLAVTG